MKKILNILFFTFICCSAFSQDIVNNGLIKMQAGKLDSARIILTKASKLQLYSNQARTWYYLGYTYKELYKKEQNTQKDSPYRDSAYKMLEKAYRLDQQQKKQLTAGITQSLKYIAATFNNDAAVTLNNLTNSPVKDSLKIMGAIKNFETFKSIFKFISPDTIFKNVNKQYYVQLGLIYLNKYEQSTYKNKIAQNQAIKYFDKVLAMDSNNVSANYSLGILYYNKAVQIINNLNYDTDLSQLNKAIENCSKIFKKALPFMKKAYHLDPQKKSTLIGLVGIYYSLNDYDKSNYYKTQLNKLEKTKQ